MIIFGNIGFSKKNSNLISHLIYYFLSQILLIKHNIYKNGTHFNRRISNQLLYNIKYILKFSYCQYLNFIIL
jgi:hypothetical protein